MSEEKQTLSFDEIQVGSIWMAADGGAYGHVVTGKDPQTKDILVRPFTVKGWYDGNNDIDWFKLQYRYYQVWPERKQA